MAWKTLDLSGQDEKEFEIELDLGENTDGDDKSANRRVADSKVQEDEPEIEVEEDEESAEEPEEQETKTPEKVERKSGKSRAKRRIEELARESQAKDELISQFKERLEALEANTNQAKADTKLGSLEAEARRLRSEIAKANSDGEYEQAADLTAQLTDVQLDIKVIKATKTQEKPKESVKEAVKKPVQESYPEAYEDWSEENPWFSEPETRDERRLARYIKKQGALLINDEGYEIDDDDLYEELNKKALDYVKQHKLKIDGFDIPEEPAKKAAKKAPTTDVQRSTGISKVGNKIRVKLTDEERRIARRYGMTDQEYAKNKFEMQNKTKTGWTQVF